MRQGSVANTTRAGLCVTLLAAALGVSATDRGPAEASGFREADVAPKRIATRLHPFAHPAADPLFGNLWKVSRRLIVPVAGVDPSRLTDTFTDPRPVNRVHEAIDIVAPRNAPVLAVTDGVVLRLTEHDSGGISLYLLAPDRRTLFYYAHLSGYADGVRPGRAVRQGEVIAYVGDTGNAGPGNYHLHFEVKVAPDPKRYWAARPRNPYPLLTRATS